MRTIECKIEITLDESESFNKLAAHVAVLAADPSIFIRILRQAAAETILRSYRMRMIDQLPKVLEAEHHAIDAKRMPHILRDALEEANADFTELAETIVEMIADSELMGDAIDGDRVHVGIGERQRLDAEYTPSATEYLRGHASFSDMITMWRQLEFGTGVYAKDPEGNPGSEYKESDGSWWYGPKKGFGLHFTGVPGAHALFDTNGMLYDDDALRFDMVFATMLGEALMPK